MSIEGVGDVVTGGLLARAVEPATGGHATGEHGNACLNCGTTLIGEHCHHCGQPAHVHRTLHAFFHDLLHGVFHFEGKIWHTLPLLAFKPGELTRRYIAGERARFVSPIALFLFSVFLMFAVFSWVGGPFSTVNKSGDVDTRQEALDDFKANEAEAQAELKEANGELAAARAAGESTRSEERAVAQAKRDLAISQKALQFAQAAVNAAPKAGATTKQAATLEDGIKQVDVRTGFSPVDNIIEHAKGDPKLLIYKLQSNSYKFSWALIPISAPLVWLLFFWKRRFGLYDHTVFVTYSIAAMSFGVILLSLLKAIGVGEDFNEAAAFLVPPIHIYAQLKGAYGLSRRSALWRTIMLLFFAFFAITMFFSLLLAMGVLG